MRYQTRSLSLFRLCALPAFLFSVFTVHAVFAETVYPSVLNADDLSGEIFSHPDADVYKEAGVDVINFTSMMATDGRFGVGTYESEAAIEVYTEEEPYGIEEFMYFLEGGVTLTSSDGTVTEIRAGDAVTIPKEWTGTWKTDGYRKIWVFYSVEPYEAE